MRLHLRGIRRTLINTAQLSIKSFISGYQIVLYKRGVSAKNTKNTAYVGIVIIILLIIFAVLVLAGVSKPEAPAATTSNPPASNSSVPTTILQSTTAPLPKNSSVSSPSYGCTAAKYFICSNATYSNAGSSAAYISLSVGQNTGQSWSSFGIGYAPQGTAVSGGIPHIMFYTPNDSSNNVGPSLASGSSVNARIPVNGTGTATTGTIWACYVNSGVLYIGNGCTTSGGVPATYVVIGTVNLTS